MNPIHATIIARSQHNISRKWISPNALRVLYRLKEKGYHAYLVGGGVRDLLLGREPKDFDIATDARPGEVKKVFRNCRLIGRRFRLAHIHFHNEIIEVATFRSNVTEEPDAETETKAPEKVTEPGVGESMTQILPSPEVMSAGTGHLFDAAPPGTATESAKPRPKRLLKTEDGMILRDNVFGTPEEDALRRDFTVNALFYNIEDFSVIDYVSGMQDLRNGRIRIIGDPLVRFTEDPVRMVRAVRFAAILGFEIEEQTYHALLELKDRVALASPSRMYEEVLKLFLLGEGEKTYQMLRQTGLFGVIFPKLNDWVDTEADGFPHTWIGKALEWVDAYAHAGRVVQPHVLFSLLFGQYIEEQAAQMMALGVYPLDAITRAVAETLAIQAQRVLIPKKVGFLMRDIYWSQQRFEKREGKHPQYFLRRPGFFDAWEYLRFMNEVTRDRTELRLWWKDFIKKNPHVPDEEGRTANGREKLVKPSYRKRKRRGGKNRKRPEDPNPKSQ